MASDLLSLLQGANALSAVYGTPDGGTDGSHVTTIKDNFTKLNAALLSTMSCVESLGNAGALASNFFGRGTVNGHFQIHRGGPAVIAAYPAGNQTFTQGAADFTGPSYGTAALPALGAGTYTYIPSLCPGWYLATEMFTDFGQEIAAGQQHGLRLTWDLTAALANTTNPGSAAGVTPGLTGGDMPGVFQVLTRHIPVEQLRGRSINLRVTYEMTATSGVSIAPYVAYSDGTTRYDAVAQGLSTSSGQGQVTFSTTESTATVVFSGGEVPATATAVEVGLVMVTNTVGVGTETLDLYEMTAMIGQLDGDASPGPFALDMLQCQTFYASKLGTDITGGLAQDFVNLRDPMYQELIDQAVLVAGTLDVADNLVFRPRYPWGLSTPWRTFDATVTPDVRNVEVIGAVARVDTNVTDGSTLTAVNNIITIDVVNATTVLAAMPASIRGMTSGLDRLISVTPAAVGSELFDRLQVGPIIWEGEMVQSLAPLLF